MSSYIYKSFLNEFQKIVKEFPDSIAISFGLNKISYLTLSNRIIQVSSYLKKEGISKGDIVALWMKKSTEYIEYLLGIWNLGAVFLPLDENTPKARVKWICKDANVKLLVTDKKEFVLSDFHELKCIQIGAKKIESSPLVSNFNPSNISALDIAYIIYTSGSTGDPKGVEVTHEGIVNFLEKQLEVFQIKSTSKILQYLSIGFDASLSEIGVSLLSGAELRIEPYGKTKTIEGLISILEKERITHICLPPSLLPILPIDKIPATLETIIIGGEVCPVETVKLWAKKFRIVNVYGPTEATVCSSLVVCDENWSKPLIGDPIPNREFYILSEDMLPVANGVSGELYLNGVGLARRYINQDKLTEEKFLTKDNVRLYKTGDRVIRHFENEIEFLGRMDRQFKLRGNLIEPMEVERVLSTYPSILLAHVKKEKINRELLVAYLVLTNKSFEYSTFPIELKNYLSQFLPKWMIPNRFVVLDNFPLNANEKLDITSLPKLKNHRPKYLPKYCPALLEKEKQLCNIFEGVLDYEPIGTKDDFFLLGGDSISMLSLLVESSLIGISISPENFIRNPTVQGILKFRNVGNIDYSKVEVLQREAVLDSEIERLINESGFCKENKSKILLTGGTGFLGSRILNEINQSGENEIYCLVRYIDFINPRNKIEEILKKQNLQMRDWTRIHFIEGDISKRNLGLSNSDWEFLVKEISVVFHFAAEVNLVLPYEDLKLANVNATREILRFCLTSVKKYLHYASTLSVFVSSDDSRKVFHEKDRFDSMKEVYGGYAQSKWVAEKILLNAIEFGFDTIIIYRFGLITGDSESGYSKEGDFFSQFLKSICELKILPREVRDDLAVDVTPVDYAARAFLTIAKSKYLEKVYHIANPKPLRIAELVSMMKEFKIEVLYVSKGEFISEIQTLELESSYFYLAIARKLLKEEEFNFIRPLDLFQATGVQFDCTNSDKILTAKQIICPYAVAIILKKYLRFLNLIE